MLRNLTIARGNKRRGGADHPCSCLHGSPGKTRAAGREGDSRVGPNKHGDNVDQAQGTMESEMTLAYPRGEIDGADQEGQGSRECMWDQEMAVGNNLQPIGVVHGVISDKENF